MRSQSYSTFWQRIHKTARGKGVPLRVMFELTYQCNFQCKHCYVPRSYRKKKRELKTKEIFSILDQLKDIGCFYLGFTGGELFVREDIMDILLYAKRCGFEIIIYTNGSLIDKSIVGELADIRPNKVDITIPAMSKEAFERISGVSGSRDKVFRAIDLLHKNGVNLGFKTCVLKENESEIREIEDFAHSLNALHRVDTMLSSRLDGSREPYIYRGSLKDTLRADCDLDTIDLKQNAKNQSPAKQLPITKVLFKCGVGVSQAAITPLGELKMCLMIDYPKYKILDSSLKNSWEKLKKLADKIESDTMSDENYKCRECELKDFCKWCPAKGWLTNGSFTACDPESRIFAEERKQKSNIEMINENARNSI